MTHSFSSRFSMAVSSGNIVKTVYREQHIQEYNNDDRFLMAFTAFDQPILLPLEKNISFGMV
jgi:hypothetical protein